MRQAVIVAAGEGSRLRPLTTDTPKHLVPVGDQPLIARSFAMLRAAGIEEVVLVLHPDMAASLSALDSLAQGLHLIPVYQPERRGLGHAVLQAAPAVHDDPFLLLLGDAVLARSAWLSLAGLCRAGLASLCLQTVDNPSAFGIAELRDDGCVAAVVEKPAQPRSRLALTGVYTLPHRIFDRLRVQQPSPRGEIELTDALAHLIQHGVPFHALTWTDAWTDAGTRPGLLRANQIWLQEQPPPHIDPSARLHQTTVAEPAWIGPAAHLQGCAVGPGVVIGAGARLRDCDLRESVIGPGAAVSGRTLQRTIVGPRAIAAPGPPLRDALVGPDPAERVATAAPQRRSA